MSKRTAIRGAGRYGLTPGSPGIRSVGAIAFGPDGIIFVADNRSATIFAFDLGAPANAASDQPFAVTQVDSRLAAILGCEREDVWIHGLAVREDSREVYLSIMRGRGEEAIPVLARIDADGSVSAVDLDNLPFARQLVEDAPSADDPRVDGRTVRDEREGEPYEARGETLQIAFDPLRTVTVTDIAFVDGTLLVAGACNEEFASALRRCPFPFNGGGSTTSVEIFHVNHGRYETASPIRTFIPYDGGSALIASYTCTPIAHFSLADLAPGRHLHGRTVADLGARNTPLDMISYRHDGAEYVLVCNTRHPMIKINAADIHRQPELTEPDPGAAGVPQVALPHEGVLKMAEFGDATVLMLQEDGHGGLDLRSYETASF